MIKRWSALLLAALIGVQLAAPAWAHEVVDGASAGSNKTGDSVAGMDANSAWHVLRTNTSGILQTEANSIYRLESTSLFNTDIPAKQIFKTNTPTYARDISKITALISWAASDTDSVALEVFVVGKISGSAADGLDYFIDMDPSTPRLDGILVGANQPYFTLIASTGLVYASNSGLNVGVTNPVPGVGYGGVGGAACAFSICPRSGTPPGFSYYSFWVANLTNTQIDDVTVLAIVRGD